MNRYFLALALSLYGVVCFAQDRREVDETKDADPNGTVTIEIVRGEVQVRGWNRDQVRVSGRLDERMEEFVFEVRDDETEIEVKLPRHLNGWQSGSSDLQISVPENSSLQVNGVSTDVEVVDIKGGVRAHSVSGEVDVANVAKRIDLSSVSGSVNLRDVDGRIRARTVSGDIDGRDVIGHGNYDSVSGSITLVTSGEVLDVESVSGSIELTLQDINEVTGNTVSGDIEISGDRVLSASPCDA